VALNNMFNAIRSANQPFRIVTTGKYCYITGTINATFLKRGPGTLAPSQIALRLDCQTNGKPCIDALGSRFISWHALHIYGEPANMPNIGLLYGVGDVAGDNADEHTFYDTYISGSFSLAAAYNYGSEEGIDINGWYANGNNVAGAYGYVHDACNHFGLTS